MQFLYYANGRVPTPTIGTKDPYSIGLDAYTSHVKPPSSDLDQNGVNDLDQYGTIFRTTGGPGRVGIEHNIRLQQDWAPRLGLSVSGGFTGQDIGNAITAQTPFVNAATVYGLSKTNLSDADLLTTINKAIRFTQEAAWASVGGTGDDSGEPNVMWNDTIGIGQEFATLADAKHALSKLKRNGMIDYSLTEGATTPPTPVMGWVHNSKTVALPDSDKPADYVKALSDAGVTVDATLLTQLQGATNKAQIDTAMTAIKDYLNGLDIPNQLDTGAFYTPGNSVKDSGTGQMSMVQTRYNDVKTFFGKHGITIPQAIDDQFATLTPASKPADLKTAYQALKTFVDAQPGAKLNVDLTIGASDTPFSVSKNITKIINDNYQIEDLDSGDILGDANDVRLNGYKGEGTDGADGYMDGADFVMDNRDTGNEVFRKPIADIKADIAANGAFVNYNPDSNTMTIVVNDPETGGLKALTELDGFNRVEFKDGQWGNTITDGMDAILDGSTWFGDPEKAKTERLVYTDGTKAYIVDNTDGKPKLSTVAVSDLPDTVHAQLFDTESTIVGGATQDDLLNATVGYSFTSGTPGKLDVGTSEYKQTGVTPGTPGNSFKFLTSVNTVFNQNYNT
jgi:hypothetical protein